MDIGREEIFGGAEDAEGGDGRPMIDFLRNDSLKGRFNEIPRGR
jgi:hypothetical protein